MINETKLDIPDGKYNALWSGYTIKVKHSDKEISVKTTEGVRGLNCKTTIEVKDGDIINYDFK